MNLHAESPEAPRAPQIPRGAWWFYVVGPPLIFFLVKERAVEMSAANMLRGYLVTAVSCAVLGGTLHMTYAFLLPRLLGRHCGLRRVGLHGASLVIALLIGLPLAHGALALVEPLTLHSPSFGRLAYLAVVLGAVLVTMIAGFNKLRERALEIDRTEQLARQATLRAQLASLQARINPHFLFNALNSVAALIPEDPDVAEQAVERLAGLFRYSLDGSRRQTVPLCEEVDAARDYLEVEALRFGERLRFTIESEPELDQVQVPPLCLLPIVENAVLHGVAQRREGGAVALRIHAEDDRVVLTVDDDGPGLGQSNHKGSGTGVADLRARVSLLYGDGAMVTEEAPGGGHRVMLRLAKGGPSHEVA